VALPLDNETPVILLVEDNPDDELLTMRALRSIERACDIHTAHDGAEAVEYLSDESKPVPSLVLLDLKLPKLNGVEVLERLRSSERTKRIPVVILTSSNERIDVNDCYRLGANSYIETVRLLGLYWVVKNVRP
jgi:CheY-like chemotaxis protein